MRRGILACGIMLLFLLQSWSSVNTELINSSSNRSFHQDFLFNQTGFIEDGVFTNSTGEVHVNRPKIQWSTPVDGPIMARTGACSVSIESLGQVWMMGGWIDPDPQQQNDEGPTDFIEIMKNDNKTWEPSEVNLPYTQQYCEAELAGNLVVVVGDWYRNSNPQQYPTGRVQIFNLDNNTWYNGTPMPSGNERGLGAMAEVNGFLYYAGGVSNSNANDATNKTFRYDPQNDTWTRMADMNHARASFEMVNFHGQIYAMGGFKGTSTWNRQAMDYVERYDPNTNTWTNMTKLPVAMFGWTGTVLNDEIVLLGGYSGGTKSTVYHWNPIEDTWSKGNDINYIGHFDTVVEEINGSIIWASGDMSTYPYNSWSQMISQDSEYQNKSNSHSAWVTSPIIDLRVNTNSRATPVQFNLQGINTVGGEISFQYRTATTHAGISSKSWEGIDGTINSTFSSGITNLNLSQPSDFIQYRIRFKITDLENWDAPDLNSMSIRTEHAAFTSNIPTVLHPRAETFQIQTSHDLFSSGEMYLEVASCSSSGIIYGSWSRISHNGSSFSETDSNEMFVDSNGVINSTHLGETLIDWSIDLGDLSGITHICLKVGTSGTKITEFTFENAIEIDNLLEVRISDLGQFKTEDTVRGGIPINIALNHSFPSTGMTLSSGNLEARINFDIQVNDPVNSSFAGWVNQTTPWTSLKTGESNTISWALPTDISGIVSINIEARSNNPFQIVSNSNMSWLTLDNENPVIIYSEPGNGDYLDSKEGRELAIKVADTSGFTREEVAMEVWVQSIDDGSNGSALDQIPQSGEYREINFTLENDGSYWWFNGTQSDKSNADQQLVYMRIIGLDNSGLPALDNTIFWTTRDAQNAVLTQISQQNITQFWEVSRDISWDFTITDANSLNDIISLQIELGGYSEFGIYYNLADSFCRSLGSGIDIEKTSCSHTIVNDEMIFSINIFAGWDVDMSLLSQGLVDVKITDVDGISQYTFQNLWFFSDDFDFTISEISDISGPVSGEISNLSIMQINDKLQIKGRILHSLSEEAYQGDLSLAWSGFLQGQQWSGGITIQVIDGNINSTILMPNSGGIIDFSVSFMDPFATRTLSTIDIPIYQIDANPPIILDSNIEQLSRYRLQDVGIGVNIDEDIAWSGELNLTCKVSSSEVQWDEITLSSLPSNVFLGKTLFSFNFDFSSLGDPSQLSPEANIDCWAEGRDDSGWDLETTAGPINNEPWLTIPLSSIGPNIEILEVKLDGEIEAGKELRAEITIKNSGDDLQEAFNISVYTIIDGERDLIGKFSQSKINSGQGITKRVALTIPDGDWELVVIIDEEEEIWELNENDNYFTKEYNNTEEHNSMLLTILVIISILLFTGVLLRKKLSSNEMSAAKKISNPIVSNKPPTRNEPHISRISNRPKRGPPPKSSEVINPSSNLAEAMAKLSLDTLPGRKQEEVTVASYKALPPGGEYEYLSEGTFYHGDGIGRWKLEQNGTFTKIE